MTGVCLREFFAGNVILSIADLLIARVMSFFVKIFCTPLVEN